jgi:serine/threonine protein phosphatase PrpC
MDLFRRIFGKTSEEMPIEGGDGKVTIKDVVSIEDQTKPLEMNETDNNVTAELPNLDDIDPKTRPVYTPSASVLAGVTQPLNEEVLTVANTRNGHLVFGQMSDVGLVRSNNQDSALSFFFTSDSEDDFPDFGLFVVADGMGGHQEGEKASAIATRTVATHITKSVYLPMISGTGNADIPPISEALTEAVQKANHEVIENVPDGGTTVTAIAVMGDLAYVAHVGDSRAYLMTSEGVEQITRDHSLVQRLIELNQLTRDEAESHPQKNVLYRALGQNDSVEVDTLTRRLPVDSRLLVCSDGLWGQISERDLYEIAMNNADPKEACERLVALAKTNGGTDNITVILLKLT